MPGNFATSPAWNNFHYTEQDYENHYSKHTDQFGMGGGLFGLFSGGYGDSLKRCETVRKTSKFEASFEFTQIPIIRPWFKPGFFAMRGWTLDKLWDLTYGGEKVSDGGEKSPDGKPQGRLVAYPTSALFVRNVYFKFDEFESLRKYMDDTHNGGVQIGWGPFTLYSASSRIRTKTRDFEAKKRGRGLDISGIQLIGFINNLIPKSPNPHPDIKPEQFVGGQ